MKKWIFAISFVALGAVVSLTLLTKNSLDAGNAGLELSSPQQLSSEANPPFDSQGKNQARDYPSSSNKNENDPFISDLIAKLLATHSDDIHLLHIQASLIKVKEFVLQRYPYEGLEKFAQIITAAFPEHAGNILALLDKLALFNQWLIENQADLLALEHQIQQGTIWEKRRELFGSDAELIWAHELSELAHQKTAMQQVIQNLNQAHDISMDERLYQLQSAISEQHEGTIQSEAVSGSVISKVFFTLDSVQDDLASMSAEERQEKINDIRSQLGLTQEQIEHLQKTDQKRESRWENGLAYMAERDQLIASLDEYSRSAALDELRQRYFGPEAVTIQREEDADFWRYKRRRIYGVN